MPIKIIKEDVIRLPVDVVVNAANRNLRQGEGLCSELFAAAGAADMRAACEKIGSCQPGHAVITPGFKLPAAYVVHAVGPVWINGRQKEPEMLAACYTESLVLAARKKARSIAFPLLSAGTYGYPRDQALRAALDAISNFLKKYAMTVYLSVYDPRCALPDKNVHNELIAWLNRGGKAEVMPEENIELPSLDDMLFEPVQEESLSSVHDAVPFVNRVIELAKEKDITEFELCRRANMTKNYLAGLIRHPEEQPDRHAACALCVALGLTLEESNELLALAGLFFMPGDRHDLIVSFFINRGADINAVNAALYGFGEQQLFFQ